MDSLPLLCNPLRDGVPVPPYGAWPQRKEHIETLPRALAVDVRTPLRPPPTPRAGSRAPRLVATSSGGVYVPPDDALSAPAAQRRAARAEAGKLDAYEPRGLRASVDAYAATLAAGAHIPLALARAAAAEDL